MRYRNHVTVPIAVALANANAAAAIPPTITSLGILPGASESQSTTATGVSADGLTVVGYGNVPGGYRAFRWTRTGGMTVLPVLPGANEGGASAVSADGMTVAGYSRRLSGGTAAVRWPSSGVLENLGTFNSAAYGENFRSLSISQDGTAIVGTLDMPSPAGGTRGFLWRSGVGLLDLGVVPGGAKTEALGISADGLTVVGGSGNLNTPHPFVWTQATGLSDLGTLPGGLGGYAWAVNQDGTVVTGHAGVCCGETHAFRWTASSGMIDLGTTFEGTGAYGRAINADGSVIAGVGGYSNSQNALAMLWGATLGMVELLAYAESRGVDLSEWELTEATGLSADGRTVVGNGFFRGASRAWVIQDLPAPCIGMSHRMSPQTTCGSQSVTFDAPVTGSGPFEFGWEVSSGVSGPWTAITDGENRAPSGMSGFDAAGATTATLTLSGTSRLPDAWGTTRIFVRVRASNACDSAESHPAALQVCLADVNCDASVDLNDFFQFLNEFDQTLPGADIDADGSVDLADFFGFLNAFDQGC